jgi:hypothetical protein
VLLLSSTEGSPYSSFVLRENGFVAVVVDVKAGSRLVHDLVNSWPSTAYVSCIGNPTDIVAGRFSRFATFSMSKGFPPVPGQSGVVRFSAELFRGASPLRTNVLRLGSRCLSLQNRKQWRPDQHHQRGFQDGQQRQGSDRQEV